MKPKNVIRKVSITFQGTAALKDSIGKIATSMNYTRIRDGANNPEYAPIINLLLAFGVEHEAEFRKWVAGGMKPALEVGIPTIEEGKK